MLKRIEIVVDLSKKDEDLYDMIREAVEDLPYVLEVLAVEGAE